MSHFFTVEGHHINLYETPYVARDGHEIKLFHTTKGTPEVLSFKDETDARYVMSQIIDRIHDLHTPHQQREAAERHRSEERRVGKECA